MSVSKLFESASKLLASKCKLASSELYYTVHIHTYIKLTY